MTADVQAVVTSKLCEYTPLPLSQDQLDPEQRLLDLELDSLAVLETIYELEEHFDITVDSDELGKLTTVSDLVAAINSAINRTLGKTA